MDYTLTFTMREIISGLVTLLMYEFIFRPIIFHGSVKGAEKEDQRKQANDS